MNTRAVRKWLPYVGFAWLLVGMFGMDRVLPVPLEIGALGLAVLSFAGVCALYLYNKEKMNRVPRKTFWTMIGALFAVSLLISQIGISLPAGFQNKHPAIMIFLMIAFMLPVIIAAVIIQIRRWHDLNASGWWILINAIPYLGHAATVIICGFIPGTRGPNTFGPDPLGRTPQLKLAPAFPQGDQPAITIAHSYQHSVQSSPPAPPRPAVPTSLENELRSLAALKADGIISEEEFNAKKRALLAL